MKLNMTAANVVGTDANSAGHWVINRSGASALELYRNASSIATGTTASIALVNENLYICKGAGDVSQGDRIAAAHVGASLTSGNMTDLYDALETYMTAVGAP
jgi:hypothetical protein